MNLHLIISQEEGNSTPGSSPNGGDLFEKEMCQFIINWSKFLIEFSRPAGEMDISAGAHAAGAAEQAIPCDSEPRSAGESGSRRFGFGVQVSDSAGQFLNMARRGLRSALMIVGLVSGFADKSLRLGSRQSLDHSARTSSEAASSAQRLQFNRAQSLKSSESSRPPQTCEEEFYMNDEQAVQYLDTKLKLSAQERAILMDEIVCTTDDPILVIKSNSAWIDVNGQAVADEIMDSIARFEMKEGRRRDEMEGGHRWIFHFGTMGDIERCKESIERGFPAAFTFSPGAMRRLAAQSLPCAPVLSLGESAVILKLGLRKNEGQHYQFFHL